MNTEKLNTHHLYGFLPTDYEGIEILAKFALDMRWSWKHASDDLWQELDENLWKLTHNPWIILQTVSRDKLEQKLGDAGFRQRMNDLAEQKKTAISKPAWFQNKHAGSALTSVAYFSMEFMLSEALPIYVGGLGNVAGDQLKSASDLGVPVTAIGLLYQQGYFRQEIDKYGTQQALFPYNDPGQLPITPLRLPSGEWLRLKISLSGFPVWLRTWHVQVGRVQLLLLDTNDPANLPTDRSITNEVYGGGSEQRIKQEIILGIGGLKLLQALNIKPQVCHMNEGHAAFLVLERASQFMHESGLSFQEALAVTRAGNLFTTHTAVAAGFDHFSPSLMYQYLGAYAKDELGLEFNEMMSLGRMDAANTSESFNMAYLAIRGSGAVNGVSKLHGKVSRHLFEYLFPRWPTPQVPVGYVTNGVHMPSWDSELSDKVWTDASGKDRWLGEMNTLEDDINKLPDETIWQLRSTCRHNFVQFARHRFQKQVIVSGQAELSEIASGIFNPETLTLGFARRFVPYKRPNLLLHDEERFIRILTNPQRSVQLVIAGKAPPFDESGKDLIRQWVQFIQQHDLYNHVVFLSDYDMLLTEHFVQGVDVWVNTPRRPWEACGTSGMKVLVNGGINLSELDGWWAEAYTPEVGWALGDEQEHGDDPAWDAAEAEALYELLEKQVVPEFYTRNERGIPARWVERIRKSMAILTPAFSANRTVREYTEKYYLPGAENYLKRAAGKGALGAGIIKLQQELNDKWGKIAFENEQIDAVENGYKFHLSIFLDDISPDIVSVELYATGVNNAPPEIIKMEYVASQTKEGKYAYHAQVTTTRPQNDYTARIIPNYEGVSIPLEDNHILWQH